MNKEKFYASIELYYNQGLIRNVYETDCLCILSFGELGYIISPYLLIDDKPIAIYASHKFIKEVVEKNRIIYPTIKRIFENPQKYSSIIYNLDSNMINSWKRWISENKANGVNNIDYNLEEEINNLKNKSK